MHSDPSIFTETGFTACMLTSRVLLSSVRSRSHSLGPGGEELARETPAPQTTAEGPVLSAETPARQETREGDDPRLRPAPAACRLQRND